MRAGLEPQSSNSCYLHWRTTSLISTTKTTLTLVPTNYSRPRLVRGRLLIQKNPNIASFGDVFSQKMYLSQRHLQLLLLLTRQDKLVVVTRMRLHLSSRETFSDVTQETQSVARGRRWCDSFQKRLKIRKCCVKQLARKYHRRSF